MHKIAVIQQPSVLLDKDRTVDRARQLVTEAADNGAVMAVLTETFIPGYPAWIWRLRPGGDWGLSEELYSRLLQNSVRLDQYDLMPLEQAARDNDITIVCGLVERSDTLSEATLYNTVVIIGPEGTILNRHRKLMPTNPERMVWGFGDATGLKVVDTPVGRTGCLMCWENYMPLARYALYSQGIELYVAPTYDSGEGWLETLKTIAREGRCWVVGSGTVLQGSDIPQDFPDRERLYPDADEWINPGDSVVIAPGGEIVAGPLHQQKGILYCSIDPEKARTAKRALDVAGHYSRPDIFTLHVNTRPQSTVEFDE